MIQKVVKRKNFILLKLTGPTVDMSKNITTLLREVGYEFFDSIAFPARGNEWWLYKEAE